MNDKLYEWVSKETALRDIYDYGYLFAYASKNLKQRNSTTHS